ncbi:MAG: hypothetical protein VKK04_03875 [Synechococcales bacterium]|nr:hypothetical protein [Synechococcales bacterium]
MTDDRIDRIEQRLDLTIRQVNQHAALLEQKADEPSMRAGFNEAIQRLGRIADDVEENKTRIIRLELRVGSLEAKVDSLEAKVDNLEAKVDNLEAQVGNLGTELQEFRTETRDSLEEIKQLMRSR